MCEPVTITFAIVAAAGAGAGAYGAKRQSEKAQRFQDRQERQAKENALAQMRIQIAEINQQQQAETEAAAAEIDQNQREALEAMSLAQVTAGEAGAFGLSYEALVSEFHRRQTEFQGAVERNLEIRANFAKLGRRQAILGKEARFINLDLPDVPKPDYLGMGLQFLGDALGLYAAGQRGAARQKSLSSGRGRRRI